MSRILSFMSNVQLAKGKIIDLEDVDVLGVDFFCNKLFTIREGE